MNNTGHGSAVPAAQRHRDTGPRAVEEGPGREGRTSTECTVVVPVLERPNRLEEIFRTFAPAVGEAVESYEFLFVVPSGYRDLADPLDQPKENGAPIRILEVGDVSSEAALLKTGARHARGEVILTLPAYYRIEADDLPALFRALEPDVDLVMARRAPRRDPWINRIQSRAFHLLLRFLTGSRIHDTGCGVRLIRREVLLDVPVYGDYHRFLPVIARHEGYQVVEVPTAQHAEDVDTRIYVPGTYLRRLIDMLGVFFLLKFAYKPLRFFGLAGAVLTAGGGASLLVLLVQRLGGQPLAGRPALVLAVLIFTLGLQFIALGLVGEIIVHFNSEQRATYRMRESAGEEE